MKRKLNLILIPITLAVCGIIAFQVDWLIKTYNDETYQLTRKSGMALEDAVAKFSDEQQKADSKYIETKLKKWVDTVKLKYVNYGDSLHIDLEYVHKLIPFPTMKTGYYMHVSLSSPQNVSITSPGMLSTGKVTPAVIAANQKNMRLDDSLSKFFNVNYLAGDKAFFELMEGQTRDQSFKSDSAKIMKYFKKALVHFKVTDPDKNPPVLKFVKANSYFSDYAFSMYFRQNVFHKYPEKQLIYLFFPNKTQWVIYQLLPKVIIGVLLIIILIFSFIYLIKIIKQQKQLADIKDDFIDNLTHEFKTPIATISAAIEGMQKFKALDDKEKTARYLDISKNELTRLNDMVTKLLNISVYDKNNLKLSLHHVDLAKMIDEIVGMEQFRAIKPVQFNVDIADSVRHIEADPLHLKSVFTNLVDNAVKYSRESVSIRITGTKDNAFARYTITDNGIGIAPTELKKVFDKFYRVPTADLHTIKGSGLGLSYVRSVIEAHGGIISVNSEINVKTEFIICIPLK